MHLEARKKEQKQNDINSNFKHHQPGAGMWWQELVLWVERKEILY